MSTRTVDLEFWKGICCSSWTNMFIILLFTNLLSNLFYYLPDLWTHHRGRGSVVHSGPIRQRLVESKAWWKGRIYSRKLWWDFIHKTEHVCSNKLSWCKENIFLSTWILAANKIYLNYGKCFFFHMCVFFTSFPHQYTSSYDRRSAKGEHRSAAALLGSGSFVQCSW